MATPAQVSANRANARRSTGPRTPAGKARAAMNAVTHGAYARVVVLAREDREAFDALRDGFAEAFAPVGRYERALVERLSLVWWKIQRAVEAEALVLTANGYDAARLALDAKRQVRVLDRIGAVEHRLQRVFERFLSILERRQALRRRRSKPPAAPAARERHAADRPPPARGRRQAPDHWLRFVRKTWTDMKSTAYTDIAGAVSRQIRRLRGPPEPRVSPDPADFLFRLAKTGGVLVAMGRRGVKLAAD